MRARVLSPFRVVRRDTAALRARAVSLRAYAALAARLRPSGSNWVPIGRPSSRRGRIGAKCVSRFATLLVYLPPIMEQERLLSDGDFDRSRASPPRSPARMGRASSTRPKLRGVAVSGFIVMLLLAGSLRFASPGSNARRGPVASDVGGLVATPLNPKRKPVRVKATIKTAAAGRPEATPKPVRVAPAGSTAISAYPLSCDASDACRRARDIAVSSWSKHPIPAPGRLRSDYAWSPFVPGRRWELSASPYTPERSQVVPQVVAAKDALPAIPRIIVQTWREEVCRRRTLCPY